MANSENEFEDGRSSKFSKEVQIFDDDCFGNETLKMTDAERYVERGRFLKSLGIPTIDSVRACGKNKVEMENLIADGSDFFTKRKHTKLTVEVLKKVKRQLSDAEHEFLSIDVNTVLDEIGRIRKIGVDHGFLLPDDDPFDLLVHPDGTWEVLIVDLERLQWIGPKNYKFDLKEERESDELTFVRIKQYLRQIGEKTV